jgi:DTW domain-containing protein YfiP
MPPPKSKRFKLPADLTPHQLQLLGLTKEEYIQRFNARENAWHALTKYVTDPAVDGDSKHAAQCRYVHEYGRNIAYCQHCWLLPYFCICSNLSRFEIRTKLIVHIHHFEWSKGTNSGSVLAASCPGTQMLMKGLPEHDAQLQQLVDDPSYTVAVLWPGEDAILPEELRRIANEKTEGRVAVVAVDATWGNARKMKTNYPANMLQVKLPAAMTLQDSKKSLLFPVRKYKGDVEDTGRWANVCWQMLSM